MYVRDTNELDDVMRFIHRQSMEKLQTDKGKRTGIDIVADFHKTKRSNSQNKFYWKNCTELALFMQVTGIAIIQGNIRIEYDQDIVHTINKVKFGVKSTAKLSVKEFITYMDRFFAFWIEETEGEWIPLESTRGYAERTHLI